MSLGLRRLASAFAALCLASPAWTQPGISFQRDRGRAMLRTVKDDIRKNYYDPTFRGADLDALFAGAEIAAATSNGEIFGVIAQAVLDLDDSHTFFLPPVRANRTEYGFQMLAVGERILVSALKPRSDAEAKGLKVGDEVLAVNGYPPRRADLQQLAYVFYTLRPSFEVEEGSIDQMMGKARKRPQLILDLRGNAGGYVRPLEWLIGYLFDRDVKISDLKSRKETKAQTARRLGVKEYLGKLVVLVDSASASAAEVLARVVQLEKRGTVIGDRTAGAVMQSRVYEHELGFDSVVFYAVSVTHADVIMGDGKSLEGTGVTPDELVLPSPEDLAAGRDPVMSRALASLGITLPPEAAGALFPVEWASY
jgi:C-terminal processing protease CtpA/Prc